MSPPKKPDSAGRSSHVRNPYYWCETEIVQKIIYPRIESLLRSQSINSKGEFVEKFRETYGQEISPSWINKWIELSGVKMEKTLSIKMPQQSNQQEFPFAEGEGEPSTMPSPPVPEGRPTQTPLGGGGAPAPTFPGGMVSPPGGRRG